jgi:ribonuclease D
VRPEQAWFKIRGKNKLTVRQLTIIQALAEWRERTAQIEDRPKNWLIRDEVLLDMAKLQPDTPAALANIRSLNERIIHRYGKTLCGLIEAAKIREPIQYKEKKRGYKTTQQHEAILDILTALVRIRAEDNSLNPAILASRKDLEDLLLGENENSSLLQGWRYGMAGKDLMGLIEGRLCFGIEAEKLAVFDKTQL